MKVQIQWSEILRCWQVICGSEVVEVCSNREDALALADSLVMV